MMQRAGKSQRLQRILVLAVCAFACATGRAQQGAYVAPPPAAPVQPLPDSLHWLPQGLDSLARQAAWHTDFTLDRSMLALAGNFSPLDEPTRQAVARLNGIAFHLFRFPAATSYDPATLHAIQAQYGALGWKHFATTTAAGRPGEAAGHTDVWLENHGVNFAGAVILLSSPTSFNLIAVSGDISTLDLLRLRGHFGIPRFSDDGINH